jgi:two-component system response regulator YesN
MEEIFLKRVLHSFVEATGLRASIIDTQGKRLVAPDNTEDTPFCQLIRSNPRGLQKCERCCARAGVQAERIGVPYIFRCHAGLIKWAAPITIKDRHFGTIVCGQVLMWEPEDFFWIEIKEMTRDLDVNLIDLLEAGTRLKVVSGQRVQAAADLLFVLANHIMRAGLEAMEQLAQLRQQEARLNKEIFTRKLLEEALKKAEKRAYPTFSLSKKEQELLGHIRLGQKDEAYLVLNEILTEAFQDPGDFRVAKARVLEIMVMLSRAAVERGETLERLLGFNYQHIEEFSHLDSVEELFLWVVRMMEMFMDRIQAHQGSRNTQVLAQAIEFLRQNYQRSLRLEDIAQAVFLSPCYLSHIFKEEIGITIMEYLTRLRIEEAKRLLCNPRFTVVQVADSIGYGDPSYFTKVFKKSEGITPSQFKQRFMQYAPS